MEMQAKIIEILQDAIVENNRILNSYYYFHNQTFTNMTKTLKDLTKDIYNIVFVDITLLKDFILHFSIDKVSKEKMYEDIKGIIELLQISKDEGTTIQLNSSKKKLLQQFLDEIRNYIIDKEENLLDKNIDIKQLKHETKKYEEMVQTLTETKSMNFIIDIDLLKELFDTKKLSEEEKKKMYQFIFKYNQKIYDFRIGNYNIKQLQMLGESDLNKLKKIFKNFGYDFDSLPVNLQKEIIEKATLNNVRKVFLALEANGYDLKAKIWSYLLVSLLIYSDNVTIHKISKLAFSKGLTSSQVLRIGSILIKQTGEDSSDDNRFHIISISNEKSIIKGSALDFEKNIKTLGSWGLSVKYIYERLPDVLACSNKVLSHNLSLFQDYGFSIRGRANKICYSTLSALLCYNSADVIDQFIECHPLGLEYLKRNLSVLREVSSSNDLLFYKLYYSNKYCGSEEAFIRIINHKDSILAFQGIVSGLSTLYLDSYKDINEKNKYEVTGSFVPVYSIDYNHAIQNKISRDIDASIFDNVYIQHINRYSDSKEPLLYNFDGIRISKMKVLRVLDTLLKAEISVNDESFLFALLYKTIISKDDFKKISNMVKLES